MSTPLSTIHVCSGVLLNNDYLHTIWFDDHAKQLAYFAGKVVKTFSAYTYIRKSWSIKVEATMEQARSWSYLYFQNGNGKTYFYFINNIEYINDNTVELFIEMDVMQTYLHEYTLHRCFVEREHSATDEIGDNLIDEGLELGEMVVNSKENIDMQELCILFLTSIVPTNPDENIVCRKHDGVFSGLAVYACDISKYIAFGQLLQNLDKDGIISIWMYPKKLVNLVEGFSWDDESVVVPVEGSSSFTELFKRNTTLDGYTPKNKKLFCYPYNFIYATNNAGNAGAYHYEKFENPDQCGFRVVGAVSPDGGTRLFPINYKNLIINYDEGMNGSQYPTCAWNQDAYKLWLAQNQNQQNFALLSGGLKIVGGLAAIGGTGGLGTVAGGGLALSGVSEITSLLTQRADMELQPPQSRGNYSAPINISAEHQTFSIMKKSVDEYHAKILDDYFSLYGYKTNLVKVPNRNVRENWTYTKTVNCHVSGSLCTEDLRKIQSVYDNGITFWKNGDLIGSYNLSNNCV